MHILVGSMLFGSCHLIPKLATAMSVFKSQSLVTIAEIGLKVVIACLRLDLVTSQTLIL